MSTRATIVVSELSLAYRLPLEPVSTAKELAISLIRRRIRWRTLWALREVSFEMQPGEVVGVIGPNGAGKSTLLRVIARILDPTSGRVIVRGHTAPVIEMGAGITTELTGFENIVLYGALLGREPREMRRRGGEIAEWAGLTEFLHAPVRVYSSGMVARLAFAIATDRRPDVLLVDEVLSVGDAEFRRRSEERIRSQIEAGTSVLLVSHNLELIERLATRVIWLEHGRIAAEGDPGEVLSEYRQRRRIQQLPATLSPGR